MIKIYDLTNAPYSNRHGSYGGMAGDKDGILINGEYWIIKYPKAAREFENSIDMSYTTSPLSEYIGSHIYDILGIPVHDTILGMRNDKLVVACKDFCKTRGQLMEMRTIKNAANRQLESILEHEMHYSSTGERVNLNELMLHLDNNPVLLKCRDVKEYFWNMVIVDILIDNNDRNSGNWGVLFDEQADEYTLAPVYDNGNSFLNKTNERKLETILNDPHRNQQYAGSRTAYDFNGNVMSAKKMLKLENTDLQMAIVRMVPKIKEKLDDIRQMIQNIPEKYKKFDIISINRKKVYIESVDVRFNELLYPAYLRANELIQESVPAYKIKQKTR